MSGDPTPRPFDEDSLRADIVKVWGEHGAHADVFDHMLRLLRREDSDTATGRWEPYLGVTPILLLDGQDVLKSSGRLPEDEAWTLVCRIARELNRVAREDSDTARLRQMELASMHQGYEWCMEAAARFAAERDAATARAVKAEADRRTLLDAIGDPDLLREFAKRSVQAGPYGEQWFDWLHALAAAAAAAVLSGDEEPTDRCPQCNSERWNKRYPGCMESLGEDPHPWHDRSEGPQ